MPDVARKGDLIEVTITRDYDTVYKFKVPVTGPKHLIKAVEGFLSSLRYDMPDDDKEE